MKLALCQLDVGENKTQNIKNAYSMLKEAAKQGANMAILPEMFCINYKPRFFMQAKETFPGGEAFNMLKRAARETAMTVIGGSVPLLDGGKLYNTSFCFDSNGNFLGKYSKAHLFDVNYNGLCFKESDTVTAGEDLPLIIDAPIKTGVSICFDIRFPEWSGYMMNKGVDLIALPAAFSRKTGPAHWELLLRARALDNQCFVAGVAPAQSECSYGHSMLCSPDASVLCDMGEKQGVAVLQLDESMLASARNSIPIKQARRADLYAKI